MNPTEALMSMAYIRKVPISSLGRDTYYPSKFRDNILNYTMPTSVHIPLN